MDSPRSSTSVNWRAMRDVRIPRRRCVGSTPTHVTPATGTAAPPGSVMSKLNAPAAPTHCPSSSAPRDRSISPLMRSSASCSSVGIAPNAVNVVRMKSGNSSSVAARIS